MKKSLLVLAFLSISWFLTAQETVKQKEVGIVFNTLDNFGLSFKTGNTKSMWRFSTLLLSGTNASRDYDSISNNINRYGFGLRVGKEYLKNITDNFEFRYGADLYFSYSYSKNQMKNSNSGSNDLLTKDVRYTPGINLVFGFNYVIHNHLVLGAELLPIVVYTTEISTSHRTATGNEIKHTNSSFSYGLSTNSAKLSIAYRF